MYKVRLERNPKRKLRILHRNMLIHFDDLLDNSNWQIRQNSQFNNPESPQRPPREAHRSKKKSSTACEDSEPISKLDDDINVQFTPEQFNLLAAEGVRRYPDIQRVEGPKMSSITQEETLEYESEKDVEKGIRNARDKETLEKESVESKSQMIRNATD